MASIRRLKKDIIYLTYAAVTDCFRFMIYRNEENNDDINAIIQDAMANNDSLRQRVNAVRKMKKDEKPQNYKAIRKDLMVAIDGTFSKLSELIKKK